MGLSFEDKIFLECLRLNLGERLKLLDKELGLKSKIIELQNPEHLAYYKIIIDKNLHYFYYIKKDLTTELVRDYDYTLYGNLFRNLLMKAFEIKTTKIPKIYFYDYKDFKDLSDKFSFNILSNGFTKREAYIENVLNGNLNSVNSLQQSLFITKTYTDRSGKIIFSKKIMN